MTWEIRHGLRRGHLADLEVVEAILLSDPRERASGYDASPKDMAAAVRGIIDDPDLANPDSYTTHSRPAPDSAPMPPGSSEELA